MSRLFVATCRSTVLERLRVDLRFFIVMLKPAIASFHRTLICAQADFIGFSDIHLFVTSCKAHSIVSWQFHNLMFFCSFVAKHKLGLQLKSKM